MSAPSAEFTRELIALLPAVRAFAISLTGRVDRSDDLVQETVMKAWAASASFQMGTNMKAWLFTILRRLVLDRRRAEQRRRDDTALDEGQAVQEFNALDTLVAEETERRVREGVSRLSPLLPSRGSVSVPRRPVR